MPNAVTPSSKPLSWSTLTHDRVILASKPQSSVATAIADVFQNNGISMGRNLAKISNIFEEIDETKSRGVI